MNRARSIIVAIAYLTLSLPSNRCFLTLNTFLNQNRLRYSKRRATCFYKFAQSRQLTLYMSENRIDDASNTMELPLPSRQELLRIELKKVPAIHAKSFLKRWGEMRVPNRPDVGTAGIPRTNMPVTTELKESGTNLQGLKLIFDASPTDCIDVDVYPLKNDASAIIVTRSGDCRARAGGFGPQVASLIEDAENSIKLKLQLDTNAFAREFSTYPFQKTEIEDVESASALPDTAFPGGERFSDILESYPEQRKSFEIEAFEAFQNVRTSPLNDVFPEMNTGIKGMEGVLNDLRAQNATDSQLANMFEAGRDAAISGQQDQLSISTVEDLLQLEIILGPGTGLQGGMDIFAGPPGAIKGSDLRPAQQNHEISQDDERIFTMFDEDDVPVLQLRESDLEKIDPDKLELEMAKLDGLIYELGRVRSDMRSSILREYSDVLLDEYFVLSMRARIPRIETEDQRALMQQVNSQAIVLVGQLAGMKQAQEVQELEKIRTICEVAMEDMTKLPDKVRSMKPLLNSDFVAYLAYAIDKERNSIVKKGMNPDREPTRWLQVLAVIKRGVFAELEKDVYLDVQAIHYVLRMKTAEQRRQLLQSTISSLPSMDVRNFKKVAQNIIDYISMQGDNSSIDGSLRELIAEFELLIDELLPESRVNQLSKEADEWAAKRVADRNAIIRANARDKIDNYEFSNSDISRLSELESPQTKMLESKIQQPLEIAERQLSGGNLVDLSRLYSQDGGSDDESDGPDEADGWGLWEEGEIDTSVRDINEDFDDEDIIPGMLDGIRYNPSEFPNDQ